MKSQTKGTPKLPDNKVAAAGIAGAATVLILYIARLFGLDDIPAEVGGALTTVLSFIAGYMKKPAGP